MASPPAMNFEVEAADAGQLPARNWTRRIAGSWVLRGVATCAAALLIVGLSFRSHASALHKHISDDLIVGVPGRSQVRLVGPKAVGPIIVGEGEECNGSLPPEYATICQDGLECVSEMPGASGVCVNQKASQQEPGVYPPPGSDKDPHGCVGSAGYRFCPCHHKCMRSWESACEEGFEGDVHCAPSGRAFPRHWGAPPKEVSLSEEDLQPAQLPADAGEGTSLLAKWIQMHLNADAGCELDAAAVDIIHYVENGQALPQCWGAPLEPQTDDVVHLPSVFGMGSSTLREWIQGNLDEDLAHEDQTTIVHKSPGSEHQEPVAFPLLWQAPPLAQYMDMVKLPCNCGEGSSTLKMWIERHMADDEECKAVYHRKDGTCSLEMSDDLPTMVA